MIHLGEYDPKLEGIWWVEEAGMSCNVYVLNEGRALIDAGNMFGMLHELSQEFDLSLLEQLFITHCHFDHVGGMGELFDWCNPKVYAHMDTLPYINFRNVPFMKIMEKAGRLDQVVMLRGGERLQAGPLQLEVIPTPGHTKGDVCYYEPERRILFSGDTVFASSATENMLADSDKMLGSMDQQVASLARLVPYPVDFLLPGHGMPAFADGSDHVLNAYIETRKGVEEDPRQPYLDAARLVSDSGRPGKALECYNLTLMLDPANMEALVYKGATLTELQHFDEALAIFEKILRVAPELEEAIMGKGFALLGLGRVDEAMGLPGFAARLKQLV
ncbi:MAG: MBL fold metallo-hydrolase [Syntrophobacterales bacterium]|jgi:glyoxylase-like metal-dependent hydrolase (beta-lactamase superfamily II)|nr:MBL fold metallo-hydrolase [Syntrophobacterales bacterium]